MTGRDPSAWAVIHCFPRYVNRKLDQKQSSQGSNLCSNKSCCWLPSGSLTHWAITQATDYSLILRRRTKRGIKMHYNLYVYSLLLGLQLTFILPFFAQLPILDYSHPQAVSLLFWRMFAKDRPWLSPESLESHELLKRWSFSLVEHYG